MFDPARMHRRTGLGVNQRLRLVALSAARAKRVVVFGVGVW